MNVALMGPHARYLPVPDPERDTQSQGTSLLRSGWFEDCRCDLDPPVPQQDPKCSPAAPEQRPQIPALHPGLVLRVWRESPERDPASLLVCGGVQRGVGCPYLLGPLTRLLPVRLPQAHQHRQPVPGGRAGAAGVAAGWGR